MPTSLLLWSGRAADNADSFFLALCQARATAEGALSSLSGHALAGGGEGRCGAGAAKFRLGLPDVSGQWLQAFGGLGGVRERGRD